MLPSANPIAAYAAELPEELVPMGEAIGITVKTDGVIVAELSEIETGNGTVSPARDAGILPGDVIVNVGDTEISGVNDLTAALDRCDGNPVPVTVLRSGETLKLTVTPYVDENQKFMGIWIKDSLTGIGTMTYYDPETGRYGALGHAISDSDTGLIIPIGEGKILHADVTGVSPGKSGVPGKLGGVFSFEDTIGSIEKNCVTGIFGNMDEGFSCEDVQPVEVMPESEIKPGNATLLSAADGAVKEYSIEITRIYQENNDNRSMMIKITDDRLIDITGGIVQGMSGSPILQDGKLVGAVTHVLINDPLKGFAVSIEDMLAAA